MPLGSPLLRKLGFGYMLSPMVAYTSRIIMQAIPARVIMQNDSDTEDVSHPPGCVHPWGQETIPGAGKPLGEVAGYTELNKAMTDDPWSPVSAEDNFNLAS